MRRLSTADRLLLGLVAVFLGALGLATFHGDLHRAVVIGYLFGSLVTLSFYGLDKFRAIKGGWRIPEVTLHVLEALGGWPGALVAQRLFHHKTRKIRFQVIFWLITLAHLAGWGWALWSHLEGIPSLTPPDHHP